MGLFLPEEMWGTNPKLTSVGNLTDTSSTKIFPKMHQAHSDQATRRSNHRLWWVLGSFFAVSIAVLFWFYTLYDVSPPATALYEPPAWPLPKLPEQKLPELDHAWAEVEAAWQSKSNRQKLTFPGKSPRRAEIDLARKVTNQQFLESNSLLIAKFWAFAESAVRCQALPWQAERMNSFGDVFADLWLLVDVELKQEPFAQNAETRLEKGVLLIDLSQLFVKLGPGSFNDAFLLEAWGMEGVLNSLAHVSHTPAQLRELLEAVNQDNAAADLLAWKVGTALSDSLLECRDKEPAELYNHGPSPLLPGTNDPSWKNEIDKALFKRNLTLLELIEARELLVLAFDQNAHSGWILYEALINRYENRSWPTSWWKAVHPNRTGKEIAHGKLWLVNWDIEKLLERVSARRCLSVILAIRLYELDQGFLPKTLDDLAPQYLMRLPLDPITGESFKWNHVTGKIYSVGGNGRDEGGNFEKGMKSPTSNDWGMVYPWRPAGL